MSKLQKLTDKQATLCTVLDELGGDGITAALQCMSAENLHQEIRDHVAWLEDRARAQLVMRLCNQLNIKYPREWVDGSNTESPTLKLTARLLEGITELNTKCYNNGYEECREMVLSNFGIVMKELKL